MNDGLTKDETKLVEHAKKAVVKYNQKRHSKGDIDTLYAFAQSDGGKIHDGACLESSIGSAGLCAERHAIANMVLKEAYKASIKSIVIADPVPEFREKSSTPCGTCRHVIWERGTANTSVICMQYMQVKRGWDFGKIQKYRIKNLYPHPYEMVEWEE
jgi:cytidine deaminase